MAAAMFSQAPPPFLCPPAIVLLYVLLLSCSHNPHSVPPSPVSPVYDSDISLPRAFRPASALKETPRLP
ncbi:hypothetical protein VZT92_009306 [Zoarces viviparus]